MRPSALFDCKGFTLVEALVAGIISTVVIAAAVALYLMNMNQISGSFVRSLTRMQYQTVIDQIESKARQATVIQTSNDPNFIATDIIEHATDVIYFIGDTGNILGGYQHATDSLKEWNGTMFVPFKVGNKNIKLLNAGSAFTIRPDRKSVLLNLSVIGISGSSSDTMLSKGETFQCRN
jgi:Tfp pilus assembly protein PilW